MRVSNVPNKTIHLKVIKFVSIRNEFPGRKNIRYDIIPTRIPLLIDRDRHDTCYRSLKRDADKGYEKTERKENGQSR